MNSMPSAKWVAGTNAALLGWNVGLLSAFFAAIGIGVGFSRIDIPIAGRLGIGFAFAAAIIVGIVAGSAVARRVKRWFEGRTVQLGYIWLAVLLVVTLLSFPAPFNFVIR